MSVNKFHYNIMLVGFLFLSIPSFGENIEIKCAWECEETSVMESFLMAEGVAMVEITRFEFKEESLVFHAQVLETFKKISHDTISFIYNHPSAYFEYNYGIKWMDNMISKKYLVYLSFKGNQWILGICHRFIRSNNCKEQEEVNMLRNMNKTGYSPFWVTNEKL